MNYWQKSLCWYVSETPQERRRKKSTQAIVKLFALHANTKKSISDLFALHTNAEKRKNNCIVFCVIHKRKKSKQEMLNTNVINAT